MKSSSETSSPSGLTESPVEIPYRRWKHATRGYIVTVYAVRNYLGDHGFHSVVIVHDQHNTERVWAAPIFLKTFKPIGRKLRIKSWWERIS